MSRFEGHWVGLDPSLTVAYETQVHGPQGFNYWSVEQGLSHRCGSGIEHDVLSYPRS